ncbi:MAG TPA: hypothetical protein VGM88_13990 [Kofleriaceae bacterium]|jgi:hypothetical protein
MRLVVLAVVLCTAAVAHAQYAPLPPPPLPEVDSVLAHRLSIGLELGTVALSSSHGGETLVFGGGLFAAGIRMTRHWELTGELGGGSGGDGQSHDAQLSLALVGLRYHVNPASPWCWFLDAGTGIGGVDFDDPRVFGGGPRLAGYIGGGIEHRTPRMSISVELRSIALSQGTMAYEEGATPIARGTPSPGLDPEPVDPTGARSGVQIFGSLSFFL